MRPLRFILPLVQALAVSALSRAETPAATELQLDELHVVARQLALENAELHRRMQELEALLRELTQRTVLTQAEAKLVEARAQETQTRADAVGLGLLTADEQKLQRELMETVRALKRAEQAQKDLMEQNERLVALLQELAGALPPMDAALAARVLAEKEAGARLRDALRAEKIGLNDGAVWGAPGTLQEAQVQDVNESLRLVVLNIGAAQGVRLGMPFVLRRNDQPIALVRAVEVREKITGAVVERAEKNARPQVGDLARVWTER